MDLRGTMGLPFLDLGYLLGEVALHPLEVLLGGAHGDLHLNAADLVVPGKGSFALGVVEGAIGIFWLTARAT